MARTLARMSRSLALLALVVASAAGALKALDQVPRALAPPERQSFASVPELERAVGERLALPAYFPRRLRWPPTTIRALGRAPRAVVLGFAPSDGEGEVLYVCQTIRAEGELPPELLPAAVVLETGEVRLHGVRATLDRLKGGDGAIWHQVSWTARGRTLRLRSRGPVDELVRMAASVHREGP